MRYAFMTLAILAVWVGTILLAIWNQYLGIFLPLFAIILTVVLFIIGFRAKK